MKDRNSILAQKNVVDGDKFPKNNFWKSSSLPYMISLLIQYLFKYRGLWTYVSQKID